MEVGALSALAIVGYGAGVWILANLVYEHVWEPLGWATLVAGIGGFVGACVYLMLEVE